MLSEKPGLTAIISSAAAFVMLCASSGCQTMGSMKPMALSGKEDTLDLTRESIVLMSLRISNQYRPLFQARVHRWEGPTLFLQAKDREGQAQNITMKEALAQAFTVHDAYSSVANKYKDFLVSIKLPLGKYTINWITGRAGSPFLGAIGYYTVPIFSDFELGAGKVVYLGRIEAVNRKKTNPDEASSGGLLPLIDQAAAGFSGGTFDVQIIDNYDQDMSVFKENFPILRKCTVEKSVLPPWERPSKHDVQQREKISPHLRPW